MNPRAESDLGHNQLGSGRSRRRNRRPGALSSDESETAEQVRWSLTPDGAWRHVSAGMLRILGFRAEELAGGLLFDYLHPEEIETVLAAHRAGLEGEERSIRHRLRRRDGLYTWFETNTRSIRDEVRDVVVEIGCESRPVGGATDLLPPVANGRFHRIRDVLADEGITPFYQPIVELETGRVIAYEALSRFPGDPAHTPDRWFDDAWDIGMGEQLEMLAVRAIARNLPDIPQDLGICINVSPPTLAASGFMSCLGTEAKRVTVELTEHLEVEDYDSLRGALKALTRAGGKTSIDDFGAGYASLAHIVKLQPDWIKLDMSLTDGINENEVAHALAQALVSFARDMGIGVIAEGIETEDELEALEEIGVRFGQGFHIGMPAPLNEALAAGSS